ncbi:hypothetical protein B0H11DRAFT_2220107 [Mycena galericulata]|nr:hypothetical protein B0H11DRAFT_2227061 [Mycena galericulata]KAJ7506190.1 hypothetical protein B0H11DRAFT_2220107 [Mycena galericulata]
MSSLSAINDEVSDADTDEEIDELAGDTSDDDMPRKLPANLRAAEDDATMQDSALLSDEDAGALAECEDCSAPLGPDMPISTRIFRCAKCHSDWQCERCCHEIHLCKPDHPLEEWDSIVNEWTATLYKKTRLYKALPIPCGECGRVIAARGARLPPGTVKCDECECGILCDFCVLEKHAKQPLHMISAWTGRYWDKAKLWDYGFVYHMGHGGDPCPHPDPALSPLLVIAINGCTRLNVRYCRCPNSEGVAKSNWEQITKNGWFRATLDHPGVCCTFRVY